MGQQAGDDPVPRQVLRKGAETGGRGEVGAHEVGQRGLVDRDAQAAAQAVAAQADAEGDALDGLYRRGDERRLREMLVQRRARGLQKTRHIEKGDELRVGQEGLAGRARPRIPVKRVASYARGEVAGAGGDLRRVGDERVVPVSEDAELLAILVAEALEQRLVVERDRVQGVQFARVDETGHQAVKNARGIDAGQAAQEEADLRFVGRVARVGGENGLAARKLSERRADGQAQVVLDLGHERANFGELAGIREVALERAFPDGIGQGRPAEAVPAGRGIDQAHGEDGSVGNQLREGLVEGHGCVQRESAQKHESG